MMDGYYIGEVIVAVVSAVIAWFAGRRQQKSEARRIEVEVLEKAIQVINRDVVTPLELRLKATQDELESVRQACKKLQYAINKIYDCNSLPSCPVINELQRQERGGMEPAERRARYGGQRKRHPQRKDDGADRAAGGSEPAVDDRTAG